MPSGNQNNTNPILVLIFYIAGAMWFKVILEGVFITFFLFIKGIMYKTDLTKYEIINTRLQIAALGTLIIILTVIVEHEFIEIVPKTIIYLFYYLVPIGVTYYYFRRKLSAEEIT